MTFVRPQRSAVPPAPNAGHYWGQYQFETDLPNTPGSEFNLPDLQTGDVAWSVDPGALFVCSDATLGAALWMQISAGNGGGLTVLSASQLDSPNNADWAVGVLAPATADTNNNALTVRLFDDATEKGVGFSLNVPASAANLTIRLKSRAETAPGAAETVVPRLYFREIPDNAVVTAWSAGLDLTAIDIPTNEFFQYDEQVITLATLGLSADVLAQFELTRNTASGSDTLTDDWDLLELQVGFS